MEQFTKEEAKKFYEEEKWGLMTPSERAAFQLLQDRLCMPFDVFHEAVEKALDRPVWTHEFGLNRDGLISELLGKTGKPSMEDIINLLPKEKTIFVVGP
jgi:hypothetical protein